MHSPLSPRVPSQSRTGNESVTVSERNSKPTQCVCLCVLQIQNANEYSGADRAAEGREMVVVWLFLDGKMQRNVHFLQWYRW